ncbi:MAG: hypothetical protein JSW50_13830 [Candidatus Latescibacterota bacterium]|nr:MAG: hypothetical protein JSW50_13830 [Candidatus Latescibacterota bacterium]
MKLVEKLAMWALLKPRVEHSLPGRLRLRIPALRRIPAGRGDAAALLERLFRVPTGVAAVDIDQRSGSVLVGYDLDRTSEDDILAFLGGVMSLVRKHWREFAEVADSDIDALADRLEEWLRGVSHSQAFFRHKLTIPDDIWP